MECVLSYSYGKDSGACLGACEELGWPVDRIVTADLWATPTIPADHPRMVAFKEHADAVILRDYGLAVEHFCSMRNGKVLTFQDEFYRRRESSRNGNAVHKMYGWPFQKGPWCNDRLKVGALRQAKKSTEGCIEYLGIAADEPERIARFKDKPNIRLPLVEAGWDEARCREWCEAHDLLSPIYENATRGGCWFCHNQGVDQLRQLRRDYPELWAYMMKWDEDSPVTFKAPSKGQTIGCTVHDFDRRFQMEDEKLIFADDKVFRWSMLDDYDLTYRLF